MQSVPGSLPIQIAIKEQPMTRVGTESPLQHHNLDRAILVGLFVTVVFTALAHGAVDPWSIAVFELLIIGLMALWCVRMIALKRVALWIPATGLPLAALVLFGIMPSQGFTDGTGERPG